MRQHTMRQHSAAMVQGQVIGTEAHYRASVQSIETARITTAQYIEYFKSNGATSATDIGKAAVAHARQFDSALPNLSPTSLHKQERAGSLSPALAMVARWVWSIETRARQLSAKEKATVQATSAPPVQAASGQATSEPDKANKAKGKKLPSTTGNTLPVERVALLAVMEILEQGIASESWQDIADARRMLSGLLS